MPEIVQADFGQDVNQEIETWLHSEIEYQEKSHQDLHQNKIPKWRKLYLGVPAEENKNFPWPNASNTVVQVVGETVDNMAARVLGLLFATHPLWVFQNYAKAADPEIPAKWRQSVEDFMDLVGSEPTELNLYEVEGLWFTDAAKLGTSFVKVILEEQNEAVIVGYDSAAKKRTGRDKTLYKGPRVVNLRHEDVLADPTAPRLSKSRLVAHRRSLRRKDLEERAFEDIYDRKAVREIMNFPDRSSPRPQTKEELQDQGVNPTQAIDSSAEWDIYECYFPWWVGKRKYRVIYSYHKQTRTVLRKVFNFYPENELPILRAKLGYRTDSMYGHGYAELLERYQEEISTIHNQRIDNATVANIRTLRVSPRAKTLDANMELLPAGLLVGEKDEIEAIAVGDVYPSTFKGEEMGRANVNARAGIEPAIAGGGTGVMSKRGVYQTGGTLAVMQESNSRVGHATSEFRHAHVMLGSLLTAMYAKFGTNGREALFGLDSRFLKEALEEFEQHRLRIPIRAATGSLNREIEKQNDMVLVGLTQRYYTAIGQLMQAIQNPIIGPDVKDYFVKVIKAHGRLMSRIYKDFGYEVPDEFLPEPNLPRGAGATGAQAPPGAGQPPVQAPAGQPAAGPAAIPPTGMGFPGGGPPLSPGGGGGTPIV